MSWDSSHIVVVGAAGGIGTQLVAQLTKQGAVVHRLDLRNDFDATDPDQCTAFFSAHPEIDTVFYAAGIALSGELTAAKGHEDMLSAVRINVGGLINVARAAAGSLRAHRGRIVVLNSAFSLVTAHGFAAYSASKAALTMICEGLRPELTPATVTVCLLGGVDTPIFHTAAERSGAPAAHEVARRFTRRIARATPGQAAHNIIQAAHKRRRTPRIGLDAHAVTILARISPALSNRLIMQIIGPYPNTI